MKKVITKEKTIKKAIEPVESVCDTCKGTGRNLPEQTCPACEGTGK